MFVFVRVFVCMLFGSGVGAFLCDDVCCIIDVFVVCVFGKCVCALCM